MASRKAKGTKKRAQRAHSNVFAMFDQDQIAEFKEAFNFVDQNRDGFIDKGCLISEMFSLWLKSQKILKAEAKREKNSEIKPPLVFKLQLSC